MGWINYGRVALIVSVLFVLITRQRTSSETILHDGCPKPTEKSSYCYKSVSKTKRKKAGGGSWWRRTKYKTVRYTKKKKICCDGYAGSDCLPACHGSISLHSCNRWEGKIIHKDRSTTTCSGGACTKPNKCDENDECNSPGYYASSDGYCRGESWPPDPIPRSALGLTPCPIVTGGCGFRNAESVVYNAGLWCKTEAGYHQACRSISLCDMPHCSNGDNSWCEKCSGEVKCDTPGYQVYTKSSDKTKCLKACSWKPGARCYPGTCDGDMVLATDCKCAEGYGPNPGDCNTFSSSVDEDKKPKVYEMEAFLNKTGSPGLIIPNPSYREQKVWTNIIDWSDVRVYMKSQYVAPTKTPPSYIIKEKTKIGVKSVKIKSIFRRGSKSSTWTRQKKTSCDYDTNCMLDSSVRPIKSTPWNSMLAKGFPTPFYHLDSITFTAYVENGGVIYYNDYDSRDRNDNHYSREKTYSINGITVSKTITVGWDLFQPEHCAESKKPCSTQPLVVPDFFDSSPAQVTWDGWEDEDSGLERYELHLIPLMVYDPNATQPVLEKEHVITKTITVLADTNTAEMPFVDAGPYYIELIPYDWAGNHKSTRRICLFDDNSEVTLIGDEPFVTLATEETGREWINKEFKDFTLIWPYRFINVQHHEKGWLNPVASLDTISRELDDSKEKSLRTTERYHNIQGVVRVDVAYQIDTGFGNPPTVHDFTTVPLPAFDAQQLVIHEDRKDGDKYTFSIRGYDAIGTYAEDVYSVKVDASPPVIEYLWLTKGDYRNISVHDVTEFKELTIEWEVHDQHSGIYEISWRLFDNITGEDFIHGNAHETPQGDAATLAYCETKYGSYARGPNCYCTPFDGCYHRHYQLIPPVTTTGSDGLHDGKHLGIHEGDYFIEVVAINRARLVTKRDLKITIDTSAPHQGTVHDGLKGQTEIDFQQSSSLRSHWNGFFDKESGVWFYMYKYGTECVPNEEFDLTWLDSESHDFTKTYNTEGHFEAPGPGTYYVTVAAYNHALDHSLPVCSDGIMVDSTTAEISEAVINGAVTQPGFVKNSHEEIMYLHSDRTVQAFTAQLPECMNKAVLIPDEQYDLIPWRRNILGEKTKHVPSNDNCTVEGTREQHFMSFLKVDSHFDISWNVSSVPSGIHDYEVGLASVLGTNPDVQQFRSSKKHQRIRLLYPNIWNNEEFYILVKTITKANMQNIQAIGPFILCKTVPSFTGTVEVQYTEDADKSYLVGSWTAGSFQCDCDPYKLNFEVGIGTSPTHANVLPFQPLSTGGPCTDTTLCTAIDTSTLPWDMHGYAEYYIIIRATNIVGSFVLASSDSYIHDVELASQGVVSDIDKDRGLLFDDTVDIDFQIKTDELTAVWNGFDHPYLNIEYSVCVQEKDTGTNLKCENSQTNGQHTMTGISLQKFKTYIQVITASTDYGDVTSASDGVTIFEDQGSLQNVVIMDGPGISARKRRDTTNLHHDTERGMPDLDDLEYQSSTNELYAHWTVPTELTHYTSDIHWSIEERAGVAEHWDSFIDYEYHRFTPNIRVHNLFLQAGRKYRFSIKFCADIYCFQPLTSNGVMVIPNPPSTGTVDVDFDDVTNKMSVEMDRFYDSDIENFEEAVEVMDHYEWTITDNSHHGNIILKWSVVNVERNDSNKLWFSVTLDKAVLFTRCLKLSVRGYTKTGLYSTVSEEIKNCSDVQQVKSSDVIDATGVPVLSEGSTEIIHEGQPVTLVENQKWLEADKDYTTYTNIISAVWPDYRSKKYPKYAWAVIEARPTDPVLYYKSDDIGLVDPCSHPDHIQCGETDEEFMNAMFDDNELEHGKRYVVCISANATNNTFEKWTQELPDLSVCSNGITVDLTPPTTNNIWIGNEQGQKYQTVTSDLTVHWNSYTDIEEEGNGVHQSGIAKYEVAVGSAYNGVDIADFTDVGVTNHKTFHGVRLQQGHTYFATVKATDFVGQQSQRKSLSIKVDITQPDLTGYSITLNNRHITSTTAVFACWTGVFSDDESGISHYEMGVGSQPGYDDEFTYTVMNQDCGENPVDEPLSLIEGHSYFVSVKAHNNAGLIRIASSWAFTVDASPPLEGHVYDGLKDADGNFNDVDFVTNTSVIQAHWTEFFDHHSPVIEYYVFVGTCKGCDDVLSRQAVGFIFDFTLDMLHLIEGNQYFVSVTACNAAKLCSTSSSDGVIVDTSPPMIGRVIDGIQGHDIQYQTSKVHLSAEWYGFVDPQSKISHYVWRVGNRPFEDNILPATNVHLNQESVIIDTTQTIGFGLPVATTLYSTIRAYNYAGMYSEACSNGFIIDDTAPIFKTHITQSTIGTTALGTSVLPSVLKVHWNVEDKESYIEEQYLSISSYIGGDFNLSAIKVEGIVRDYTFTGLHLHDGSYYDIHLTACNGAKHCTESFVKDILVDSSPPTSGMFAIDTDHAANLKRQPDTWMSWNVIGLRLAWIGFEDQHSGIDKYLINVGKEFFGDDLNKNPGVPISRHHVFGGLMFDEGMVQTLDVQTGSLTNNMHIFISMWAINKVGLPSAMLHGEFELIFGGVMSLVRRCDAHTCYGHCVCAPHGLTCESDTLCTDVTSDNSNTLLEVEFLQDITFPTTPPEVHHSAVDSMMAARWTIYKEQGKPPLWYEWSVGESTYPEPKGVYNEVTERVWHDAGRNTSWIVALDQDHLLKEYLSYCFFVRVWYDVNTYAIFKSNSFMIYARQPLTITILGKSVKEIVYGTSLDVDYFDSSTHVFVDWAGKFNNNKDSLYKYHVYISTSPGGHDAHILGQDLPISTTHINITGLSFLNSTRYYTVVQAYNKAGLHTTDWSDGFVIDPSPPNVGVVHDGNGIYDIHAINSSEMLSWFWFGFTDVDSGIKNYNACISTRSNGRCDIVPWTSVGIATRAVYDNSKYIDDGIRVYHYVRAVDAAGHVSKSVISSGVVIDRTPPIRSSTLHYNNNVIQNPSFENYVSPTPLDEFESLSSCEDTPPEFWTASVTCLVHVESFSEINKPPDGSQFIVISGSISQNVGQLTPGKYKLSFYTSHILNSKNSELSSAEGYIEYLDQKYVFLIHSKPRVLMGTDSDSQLITWQYHEYYISLNKEEEITITIGTVKTTAHFGVEKIQLEARVENQTDETVGDSGHVEAKPVFTNDWSSIHAEWNFVDDETTIIEYMWAIGTVEGGTQLQDFKTVGRQTFAYAYDLHLVHNSVVFVTVVAINRAGLRTVSYSSPIIIDKTPPVFSHVYDGNNPDVDVDGQRENEISATWGVEDPESGIQACEWAIGTMSGDMSIQSFTSVTPGSYSASTVLDNVPTDPVYVTVKCTNQAGLSTIAYTDGVFVKKQAPSIDNVLVEVLGASQTQYPVMDGYHSNSTYIKFRWAGFREDDGVESYLKTLREGTGKRAQLFGMIFCIGSTYIKFRWVGFQADEGIDGYLVGIEGPGIEKEELVKSSTTSFSYASFMNLNLEDGVYTAYVKAINKVSMYSTKVTKELILFTMSPVLTGSVVQTFWNLASKTVSIKWPDVFTSPYPMYYEVTVNLEGAEGDLIQWQETVNTELDFVLDTSKAVGSVGIIHVTVRAISFCGKFAEAKSRTSVNFT